jgi:hypothetical protein
MLQWFNQNATTVQAITAIFSVVLTVIAIAVTWRYVALTKDIAENTHMQLSAILQPMLTMQFNLTTYGSSLVVDTGEETFHVNGRVGITNTGKSPVKFRKLYAVLHRRQDSTTRELVVEIDLYSGRVLMPEEAALDEFSIDVPSGEWHYPDVFGLRVICTDLSELIEHEFNFHPTKGVRHSSTRLTKQGPFERLKGLAAKIEAKVDELPELKNPSRTSQEDK